MNDADTVLCSLLLYIGTDSNWGRQCRDTSATVKI